MRKLVFKGNGKPAKRKLVFRPQARQQKPTVETRGASAPKDFTEYGVYTDPGRSK